jgi:hypothetical protein
MFLLGFWGDEASERGFLLVNLWWNAWWNVVLSNHVFGREICDSDSGFIFGDSRFGNRLQVRSGGGFRYAAGSITQ